MFTIVFYKMITGSLLLFCKITMCFSFWIISQMASFDFIPSSDKNYVDMQIILHGLLSMFLICAFSFNTVLMHLESFWKCDF